jgi:hypothetical protein
MVLKALLAKRMKSETKNFDTRDKLPEGTEPFCVAYVKGAPNAKICVLEMDSYTQGEAALGLLQGVLATQVGSTLGSPQSVRVVYDQTVTSADRLSQQSGFEVVDKYGTRPFVIGPDNDQKYYLQQTPLTKLITELPRGGKVGDSALFATRLNAYCNGLGAETGLQQDCAYLSEENCALVMDLWKSKHTD